MDKKMDIIENKVMDIMEDIEYGFLDEFGNNIINVDYDKWENEFYNFYYLLSPDELLEKKCGVCWDQVELERKLFNDNDIDVKTYFIFSHISDENLPSHTFLVYKNKDFYYWFEHSWGIYKGIHKYDSLNNLLLDVKSKFLKENNVPETAKTYVYEYSKPKKHLSCLEFYKYCESQKFVEI